MKQTFVHILYSHDRRRQEAKAWGPTGGEYEVAIIYRLLHLRHDHYGIFLLEGRVIFPNASFLGFVEISFVISLGGIENST